MEMPEKHHKSTKWKGPVFFLLHGTPYSYYQTLCSFFIRRPKSSNTHLTDFPAPLNLLEVIGPHRLGGGGLSGKSLILHQDFLPILNLPADQCERK